MNNEAMSYLRYIRIKHGKTQTQFAIDLGVSQGSISKMEVFALPIGLDELRRLRMAYGVNINRALDRKFFERGFLHPEIWKRLSGNKITH